MCKVDRMRNWLLALVTLGCAVGCGDNSRECGPGTDDVLGECVPSGGCAFGTKLDDDTGNCVPDGPVVCSEGTAFDPLTGTCKIDPSSCRDGTVLIHNACVDPTAGYTINVQEGPEPNGLGIVEASAAQAGNISLGAAGSTFIVHGTIDPWRDADMNGSLDPDVDTFVLTVTAPTLLHITADGVHGITAGFVAVAAVGIGDPLASWRRFGIRVSGDTSKRQVLLPRAGTYRIAIGDTRTLDEYLATGSATAAPGGDDGDYYVSITQPPIPTPTTLTSNTVTGTSDGSTLLFYAPPAGQAITAAQLSMPSDLAQASVVLLVNHVFRAFADETTLPAFAATGALSSGDTTTAVIDFTYAIAPAPTGFTLGVTTINL